VSLDRFHGGTGSTLPTMNEVICLLNVTRFSPVRRKNMGRSLKTRIKNYWVSENRNGYTLEGVEGTPAQGYRLRLWERANSSP